jgi:hypothetical protein
MAKAFGRVINKQRSFAAASTSLDYSWELLPASSDSRMRISSVVSAKRPRACHPCSSPPPESLPELLVGEYVGGKGSLGKLTDRIMVVVCRSVRG